MPKKSDAANLDWFGAETEDKGDRTVASMLDGFKGVPFERQRTREVIDPETGAVSVETYMKQYPAPRGDKMHVKTTGGKYISDKLIQLKNRYKLLDAAFYASNPDDKELWERRRAIAFNEMQAQAYREKLQMYLENPMRKGDPAPRPKQVELLQQYIDRYHGAWLRLIGQE
jgi:hypothetical protein